MDDARMDRLLATLAHPARRRTLDLLMAHPGMSVKALASHFEVSRIAVHKHLKVLEEAELVLSRRSGRVRQLYFNPVPIQEIHDRWTTKYSAFWSARMVDIKARVEGRAAAAKEHKRA